MKLYFMKQSALEIAKGNLAETFSLYYTNKDNKWLWNVCGEDPFVEFKEIQEFSLAPLDAGLGKGEINLENCKLIYKNLMFITESQASDERLWAGLTHSVFYEYMRKRWGYDVEKPKSPKKSIGEIKTRYFFEGGTRAGFFRNTLAKCWWVGRALYDKTKSNPFEKLDILGSNDFSTKVTDIFYSNTYASNPIVLDGIIECFKHYNNSGTKLLMMQHIRPTLQLLNAIGGGIVLDCLSSDEISEIMIENIDKILQGDNKDIESINDDYIDDAEDDNSFDSTQESNDDLYVALGCKVSIEIIETGIKKSYQADYVNGTLPQFIKSIMGKKKGDTFENNGKILKIIDIA